MDGREGNSFKLERGSNYTLGSINRLLDDSNHQVFLVRSPNPLRPAHRIPPPGPEPLSRVERTITRGGGTVLHVSKPTRNTLQRGLLPKEEKVVVRLSRCVPG